MGLALLWPVSHGLGPSSALAGGGCGEGSSRPSRPRAEFTVPWGSAGRARRQRPLPEPAGVSSRRSPTRQQFQPPKPVFHPKISPMQAAVWVTGKGGGIVKMPA